MDVCCVLPDRGFCEGPITRSLVQRSPTEFCVSEYDLETSTVRPGWNFRSILFCSLWDFFSISGCRIINRPINGA